MIIWSPAFGQNSRKNIVAPRAKLLHYQNKELVLQLQSIAEIMNYEDGGAFMY